MVASAWFPAACGSFARTPSSSTATAKARRTFRRTTSAFAAIGRWRILREVRVGLVAVVVAVAVMVAAAAATAAPAAAAAAAEDSDDSF